jgi:O-antigen/teichoic acid export membrane protein
MPGIVLGEAMLAAGMQKANMTIQAAAVPVLITMLAALIPSFGASGAAAAVAITYFGIVAAVIVVFRTKSGLDMPLRWLKSTALVAACVLIAFLLTRSANDILSTAITVAVGLVFAFIVEKAAVVWMVRQVTASLLPGR